MKKLAGTLALALALAGCGLPYTPAALPPITAAPPPSNPPVAIPAATEVAAPVTVLISIDGFRPDYLDRGVTPNLSRLAAAGVSAAMRPSFPSKTFPNHWTLVTGLRPDRNGIVANSMEDPRRPGETFTMASDDPFWWNAAEPIWVTAQRAGIRTATMFWPGSNVAWGGARGAEWPHPVVGGTRPDDWQQFNQNVDGVQRARAVIDWMRRPAAIRPRFVTLYFDTVDTAGHAYGPDDPRTTAAVREVDGVIGALATDLAALRQPANLVIVSDHGMAATSSTRLIALDAVLPAADARVFEAGPYASFYPAPGRDAAVAAALLRRHAHMQCWRKDRIPPRLHYGTNPRVPPYLCLAEDGWTIAKTRPAAPFAGGAHGYDNAAGDMRALFIASGPAFVAGQRIGTIDNVAVAPLLRRLLGLPPGAGLDGDDAAFRRVLAR